MKKNIIFLLMVLMGGLCYGQSRSFDAVDDEIIVAQGVNLGISHYEELTLMCWVWMPIINKDSGLIGQARIEADNGILMFIYTAGQIGLQLGGIEGHLSPAGTVSSEQWTHVAVVFDDNRDSVVIYRNGETVYSAATAATPNHTNENLTFGSEYSGYASRWFPGKMDDVCIFNRAISQTEIKRYMTKPPQKGTDNLTGYWNFDEPMGSMLTDSVGRQRGRPVGTNSTENVYGTTRLK